MAITQTITTIPTAGHRGVDTRETFVTKQEAFQDALTDTTVTELNTFGSQANTLATEVNTARDEAVQAKNATLANYKGVWSSIITYLVGESVSNGGFYWISNVNANLNNTPVEGANWSKVGTVGGNYLALSGGTMTGAITALKETSIAMGDNAIDLSLGNLFTKTISGATTFTVSNVATTGTVNSFILELTNAGSATITWFGGVKWAGGTAPTLTTSGVDILGFYTKDGGTTYRGIVLAKDSK